jgi:hypothetical protein
MKNIKILNNNLKKSYIKFHEVIKIIFLHNLTLIKPKLEIKFFIIKLKDFIYHIFYLQKFFFIFIAF